MLLLGAIQQERPIKHPIPVAVQNITPADSTPPLQLDTSLAFASKMGSIDRVALLPELDIQIAKTSGLRASVATQTDAMIIQANIDIDELRLTSPPGNNAWERLIAVAFLDPQNRAVQRGLQRILARYIQLAKEAETRGKKELSLMYMRRAELVLFGSGKSSFSWQADDFSVLTFDSR